MTFAEHILHVDMDAFFVEVERLDRPDLRGIPVVVGGMGSRGVVAAASYEARRHGVSSAMPTAEARRRCPVARFVAPNHGKYREMSRRVFDVLESVTPAVEALSVDEAFLDVGGLGLHYDRVGDIATDVRRQIRRATGLPSSAGAARTKMLAKLASETAKPDGQLVVAAGEELAFLHPMPVRSLWGVGEATHAALDGLGVRTIGELAALPKDVVRRRLGEVVGAGLWELAWGRDQRSVLSGESKSLSVEQTYELDLSDPADIDDELFRHCHELARRLRAAGLAARTVALKVRFADFTTITRSNTVADAVFSGNDLYEETRRLAARAPISGKPIRLLGVAASGLVAAEAPRQLPLGEENSHQLAAAADAATTRYGDGAVKPARLVKRVRRLE